MTVWAVLSAYTFGLGYFWLTGTYFFHDAYIPIGVFLGMHLLFTDPSTAPRTSRGRIIFGILYRVCYDRLYCASKGNGSSNFLRQAAACAHP